MKKGVEILLVSGTRIPKWISNQTLNVKVARKVIQGKNVRSLQIKGGESGFGPGGMVDIKMPGSDEWWTAFDIPKVLEIIDLKGNLIKRNWCLCEKCFTNTGKATKESPSKEVYGRIDFTFQCTECGNVWEIKR